MGCSSSALSKAGDSSRLRGEESESGFAQPKPLTLGRETTIYDQVQKESLPPLEKLQISAMSTATGVTSLHEWPLAKDAADPLESTEKTQPLEGPKESGLLQPGGKHDTPGAEEKKDVETVTEVQPSEGNVETEPLEGGAQHQPLRIVGERDSPGVVGDTEILLTARETKPLRIAEKMPPLEAGRELQPREAMGKPPLLETVPKETEAPEILEGSQLVETPEEQEVQETLGRDEQSQLLKTMHREKGFLEIPEGSQLVKTAVKNDLIHKTPEGPENMEQIQPEGVVGSMEHPAGMPETGTDMEMVRKIHTSKEDHHIEGETGEKVETEREEVSEGAETQEEETGEAVDLLAATEIELRQPTSGVA
ncbi:glutamate-rich protein 5 isoform X2 [Desmodus rotundus]|uniref:glutamate-rich protein 5 isoform X2 n=1 Tax=Desmodus rotundus TaxID=9430 RepID=UPI00238117AA|nr:glutamate-rich protein 5 isoform X2 [Desmodus rotundus]